MTARIQRYEVGKLTKKIFMPNHARLLYVEVRVGKIYVHALVDTVFELTPRLIQLVKTNTDAEGIVGSAYVGSIIIPSNVDDVETIHIFDGGYQRSTKKDG